MYPQVAVREVATVGPRIEALGIEAACIRGQNSDTGVFVRPDVFSLPSSESESTSVATLVAAGIVSFVAVFAHHEILSYWFTGGDTLTLVEKSRMRTVGEAIEVLTSPLMYGTNFSTIVALFYRPVANLSYAFDFWLWGLDPFGYHLTDLFLHATAAVLTFLFVRRVASDTLTGTLAGCLLAVHPITAEVVPTPARRHDVLAVIFVLCSLLAFVAATRTSEADRNDRPRWRRRLFLVGSVLAYLLAVGAKEVGAIAPPLVGAWFLLVAYDRGYGVGETLWRGLKIATPYAIVTLAYLWWRFRVLGGLGGYREGPWKTSEPVLAIVSKYVLSILYPIDIVRWQWGYDLQLVPDALYVFLVSALVPLAYALSRVDRYRELPRSDRGRLASISIAWLVVLGAVFVQFGRYSIRSGYVALVPTAAILALVVVATGRELVDETIGSEGSDDGSLRDVGLGRVAAFLLSAAVVCSLVWVSPLVYPYDDWERAGEVASKGLPAAASAYEERDLPQGAIVAIAGIPQRPGSPGVAAPRPEARTVAYFYANTVASWIRLTHPDSEVATYVGGRLVPLGEGPVTVNATVTRTVDRHHYRLRFRYVNENTTNAAGSSASLSGPVPA